MRRSGNSRSNHPVTSIAGKGITAALLAVPADERGAPGRRQKKPLESLDSRGFPLCAEGDLNPHPLSRTSTSS